MERKLLNSDPFDPVDPVDPFSSVDPFDASEPSAPSEGSGRSACSSSAERASRRTEPEISVRQAALNLLGGREYSRLSLARKLRQKAYPDTEIEPLLDEFADSGWLDDARYARLYIRSRLGKGHGPLRIQADISHKGIERELFHTVLQQLEHEEAIDWCALCQQTYNRRFAGKPLPRERAKAWQERAKRQRYLAYRGFTAEQIRIALEGDSDS